MRGQWLGKYEVLGLLASGGMAELYLARGRGLDGFEKLVALKRVLPHLARDPEFVDMFLDEARLAGTLDHPNIASVIDIGRAQGNYFFAMEYVHGRDLRSVLRESARGEDLTLACGLAILTQAAAGLHYAHERRDPEGRPLGIVHRDVSPSNVLISYDGGVKIIDFGIAKVAAHDRTTAAGVRKGKIGYMSPEQCLGYPMDRRSDVYNLGILLYETTTMRRLFAPDNEFAVMNRISRGDVTPPSQVVEGYPEALERIVLRALARDADNRYPNAAELQNDLELFAQEQGMRVSPAVLGSTMHALFGDVAYPSVGRTSAKVDDDALTRLVESTPAPIAAPRSRTLGSTAALVGVIAGVAVGAYALGSRSGEEPSAPPDEQAGVQSVAEPVPETPPTKQDSSARAPTVVPVPVAVPTAAEPEPPEPSTTPEPAAVPKKKSKRKRRPKDEPTPPSKPETDEPAPSSKPTTADKKFQMLPPSERGR